MTSEKREGGATVDLTQVPPEQLQMFKQQLEQEVDRFGQYLGQLQVARQQFMASGRAIEDMSKAPSGSQVLVPLSESLYIPGKVVDTEKYLVDIGTGYLVEKTAKEGIDYANRKTTTLVNSMEKIASILQEKRNNLNAVNNVLRQKILMAQQHAAQQQQAGDAAAGNGVTVKSK